MSITSVELDKMAVKLLACGLDPLNSLHFSIALEDTKQRGEDDIILSKSKQYKTKAV